MQSAEPKSQTREELMEKTDMVDYPHALKYIRGALTKSKLRRFIRQQPVTAGKPPPRPPLSTPPPPPSPPPPSTPAGSSQRSGMETGTKKGDKKEGLFYDAFKTLLSSVNDDDDDDAAATAELPKLDDLITRLGVQFEKVFAHIALTQHRGILHRSPLRLHQDCDKDVIDIAMCCEVHFDSCPWLSSCMCVCVCVLTDGRWGRRTRKTFGLFTLLQSR